jgi:hypothetical protein
MALRNTLPPEAADRAHAVRLRKVACLDLDPTRRMPVCGDYMTVMTMSGRKVLLCFAVRQVQQPTDQKKDGKQEQTEYGHNPPSWALLMLVLPFLIVVVRVMPSDFESASSESPLPTTIRRERRVSGTKN